MRFIDDTTRADETALPPAGATTVPDSIAPVLPARTAAPPWVVWVMDRAFGLVALCALTWAVVHGSISAEAYIVALSGLGASHYGVRALTSSRQIPAGLGVLGLVLLTGLALHLPMAASAWRAVAAVPFVGSVTRRAVAAIAGAALLVGCASAPSPVQVLHTTREVTCSACNLLVKAEAYATELTGAPDAGAAADAGTGDGVEVKADAGAAPGDAASPVATFDASRDLDAATAAP